MGYNTIEVNKNKGLNMAKGKEVIEASKISYFNYLHWQNDVKKVEIGDNGKIYFTLNNEDFVVVKFN